MINKEQKIQSFQTWYKKNKNTIEQIERSKKIGQCIKIPQQFLESKELKMYKLYIKRCDNCHQRNLYKFIVNFEEVSEKQFEQKLPIFLCLQCVRKLEKQIYYPMDDVLQKISEIILSKVPDRQQRFNVRHRCSQMNNEISKKVDQFVDTFTQKIESFCYPLRKELELILKLTDEKRLISFFDDLFPEQKCDCNEKCCLCQFDYKNPVQNCKCSQQKMRQRHFLLLLKTLPNMAFKNENHLHKLFENIIEEMDHLFLKGFSLIQRQIKKIIQWSEDISFRNDSFVKDMENARVMKEKQISESINKKLKQDKIKEYIEEGVVNHLTYKKLHQFPQHLKKIKINFWPEIQPLKVRLEKLKNISKMTIHSQNVAQLIVQDLRTIKNRENNPNQQNIQHFGFKILNQNMLKTLKQIHFNCKIPADHDHLFTCFESLDKLNLKWNFSEDIEHLDELEHFKEDYSPLEDSFPLGYEEKHCQTSLWIGGIKESVNREEIQKCCQHLTRNKNIDTIVAVQRTSPEIPSKILSSIIENTRLQCLVLKKITIKQTQFTSILQKNKSTLECLSIKQCQDAKLIFNEICQLPNLQKLVLNIVSIKFEKSLPSLKVLIIEKCTSDLKELAQILSHASLTTLSLYQCRFVSIPTLKSILMNQKQTNKLEYLNLGNTKTNKEILSIINRFTNIKKLNVRKTDISLFQFMNLLQSQKLNNLRGLEKLSLQQGKQAQEYNRTQRKDQKVCPILNTTFRKILNYFPLLSHLDISQNKYIDNGAIPDSLHQLCFLNVKDTQYKQNNTHGHYGNNCPYQAPNVQQENIWKSQQNPSTNLGSFRSWKGARKYLKILQ